MSLLHTHTRSSRAASSEAEKRPSRDVAQHSIVARRVSTRSTRAGMVLWCLLLAILAALGPIPATAQDLLPPAPYAYRQLDDPAQEAKALALMETLRCLKCQSQSIADSDAPMAGDMRHQVRERIAAGEQPEAIRQWLIERYGDYVTYTPQVRPLTAPLFGAPVVFLLVAGLLLRRRFRKTKAAKP